MDRHDVDGPLDAGSFSAWRRQVRAAIAGAGDSAVPCGDCTACCTSSQFVHIGPDETDTLAHVPPALQFPAPGLPAGHVLLGYDERGHCPMLVDGSCSIYDHRPRTCRTYDCRVFPAAGLDLDGDPAEATKVEIGRRARRWRFDHPAGADRAEHDAVRAAAADLAAYAADWPDLVPATVTARAVLAVELGDLYLDGPAEEGRPPVRPDPDSLRAGIGRIRRPGS